MISIIGREITAYFVNPAGYVLIGSYGILSGICFVLSVVANMSSNMISYFGVWLYFVNVILVCLLSFRFFSEEKKNKTDQLLLTAPISLFSIVMGKFLSAVIIFTVATLINLFYEQTQKAKKLHFIKSYSFKLMSKIRGTPWIISNFTTRR